MAGQCSVDVKYPSGHVYVPAESIPDAKIVFVARGTTVVYVDDETPQELEDWRHKVSY